MSYEDELATRKRRYKVMMGMRIPFMIWRQRPSTRPRGWRSTLLVLSIPLPWMAVLIANDRLPTQVVRPSTATAPTATRSRRANHPVIDG